MKLSSGKFELETNFHIKNDSIELIEIKNSRQFEISFFINESDYTSLISLSKWKHIPDRMCLKLNDTMGNKVGLIVFEECTLIELYPANSFKHGMGLPLIMKACFTCNGISYR